MYTDLPELQPELIRPRKQPRLKDSSHWITILIDLELHTG